MLDPYFDHCDCAGCEDPDVVYVSSDGVPTDYVHPAEQGRYDDLEWEPVPAKRVTVPVEGEWVVRDGKVTKVSIDHVAPGVAYVYGLTDPDDEGQD